MKSLICLLLLWGCAFSSPLEAVPAAASFEQTLRLRGVVAAALSPQADEIACSLNVPDEKGLDTEDDSN